MTTAIAQRASVTFVPPSPLHAVARVGLLGGGDVVRHKYGPALQTMGARLDGLVVCSLEPTSPLAGPAHRYYPLDPEGLLPLDHLHEAGFLGSDTLWILATPSHCHVSYALMLAGLGRVAIEKPVAATSREARLLLPFAQADRPIYPIDHKLFNASALAFVDACRADPAPLERVRRIEAVFYETGGIGNGRRQEDTIADVQWHLLVPIVACFNALGIPFTLEADQVQVARHAPDPQGRCQTPTVWTASRLRGRLLWANNAVAYDFHQAKAAPRNEKHIRLYDGQETLVSEIDLNESGWRAHARVLQALLQPVVDMRHTLSDALRVMELVDACRLIAREVAPYAFGDLPTF